MYSQQLEPLLLLLRQRPTARTGAKRARQEQTSRSHSGVPPGLGSRCLFPRGGGAWEPQFYMGEGNHPLPILEDSGWVHVLTVRW